MTFNPKALLLLVGFAVFITLAASARGGTFRPLAEALTTIAILVGIAGLISLRRTRTR